VCRNDTGQPKISRLFGQMHNLHVVLAAPFLSGVLAGVALKNVGLEFEVIL